MTLTEDEALAIVWGDHITRQEISQHRWYTREIVVFRHEGAMMGFYYNDPATELQEGADVFDAILCRSSESHRTRLSQRFTRLPTRNMRD